MTVRGYFVPDTAIRGVEVPGAVRATYWPSQNTSDVPFVELRSLMMDGSRCECVQHLQFTVPGWQAFIAAAKAGELDHLLDSEAS